MSVSVPLSYLLLNTRKVAAKGKRTEHIARWFQCLKEGGLKPRWILTDKDLAEVTASRTVWDDGNHQLCHCVTRGVISLDSIDRRRYNSRETTPGVLIKVNKRKITFRFPGRCNACSLNRDSVIVWKDRTGCRMDPYLRSAIPAPCPHPPLTVLGRKDAPRARPFGRPSGPGLLSALASDPFRVGHHRPEHPRSPRTAPN
jgi:hypothetical protein